MTTPLPADRGPWQWRKLGNRWMLTTCNSGAQVVLRASRSEYLMTRDPQTGYLVELMPDTEVAKRLESLPTLERRIKGLEEAVRALSARLRSYLPRLDDSDEPGGFLSLACTQDVEALELGRRALGEAGS